MQNLNIFLAFGAGLISFLSPCVLPLVPSYISFIAGQGLQEIREGKVEKKTLLLKTIFFVLGFSLVFVVMGIVFSGTAASFSGALRWINLIAGTVVIIFGLNLIFNFIQFLNYEKRFHFSKLPKGAGGSLLIGMAFAAGWSPCIGPILASILALAAGSGNLATGVLLLSFYSIGLALPFVLTSLFLDKMEGFFARIKPKMPIIQRLSGVVLIIVGFLMIFGQYQQITNWLFSLSFNLRQWHEATPTLSRILFTLLFLAITLFISRQFLFKKKSIRAAPIRFTIVLFGVLCTILQLSKVIEFPLVLASWLGFQGI